MGAILKRLSRYLRTGLLAVLFIGFVAGPALAALKDVGPVDVTNGFPVWYRDTSTNNAITIPPNPEQTFPQGLPLQLCLSQTLVPGTGDFICGLLAEETFDPTQPIIFPSNFPGEAFWFTAESGFTGTGDIGDALLVIAMEAAFAAEEPIPGDQVSFARVRIRIDVNTPGNYRITHPYGVKTFTNVPAGTRTINFTSDIGIGSAGDFTGALNGAIGPFVTWDGPDFPVIIGTEAFIGNPNVEHTITGSPFGTNVFRVERVDAQGNTLSSQQSDLFAVSGKIFTTPIASPLKATRASYVRDASGAHIYVFAEADIVSNSPPTLSTLEVSGAGINPTLMSTDGAGNFYAHLEVAPDAVPASVSITNIGDVPPKIIEVDVVDEVAITSAVHDDVTGQLTLSATSSDQLAPPVLTTVYGDLTAGQLVVNDLPIPTPTVEVTSSAGGVDRELVTMAIPGNLFFPNGGEILTEGETYLLTWASVPGADSYRLRYFDADNTIHVIDNLGAVTGYSWTVPFEALAEAGKLFRVTAFSGGTLIPGTVQWSAAPFTIASQLSPNGGETLTLGQPTTLTWAAVPGADRYRLFYFDADNTPHAIGVVVNNTSFDWTVPLDALVEAGKRFRVTAFNGATNLGVVQWSDGTFTIE